MESNAQMEKLPYLKKSGSTIIASMLLPTAYPVVKSLIFLNMQLILTS
jgi:hypothetical protein